MEHKEVGKIWDENAANWSKLNRMGYDLYRDHVNTPAFLSMLPNVNRLKGLDIGCGEGYNTRQVAKEGAVMTAIDISPVFIEQAKKLEEENPLGIEYNIASAVELPFEENAFDFAVATMSFMDIAETEQVIKEAWRVLKRGGFLQFSISHPCFSTPKWEWICDEDGRRAALKCGDYFRELNGEIEEWIFSDTPDDLKQTMPKFKIPVFTRTLSKWLNLLIDTGFVLEQFAEPKADDETIRKYPSLADTQVIAYFLIIRCRKA
ncbi:MAG: class I SAM-dependent methyltransferase [Planctomycetota bacterium]|jgi:ubiquinone/menaquinone biosynthesis C-methylase UbiE